MELMSEKQKLQNENSMLNERIKKLPLALDNSDEEEKEKNESNSPKKPDKPVPQALPIIKNDVPERPKFKLGAHEKEVLAVKYDYYGNNLATCGGDGFVKVWDPQTGKILAKFKEFSKPVTCLKFSADSSLICAGSVDKTVKILDLKTQRAKHSFTGHNDTVNNLSILMRTSKIITGSSDRTIKAWDYDKLQISQTVFL